MDRVKYPSGSEVKIETLIDNVQTKAYSNLKKRLEHLIGSYGLNLTVTNDSIPSTTDFETTTTAAGATISVAPGTALTDASSYIKTSSAITTSNLGASNTANGYAVILTYLETGSDPVKALNAFVFDKLGSQSLNRNTVFSDSVSLSLQEITTDITTLKSGLTSDQIVISAV